MAVINFTTYVTLIAKMAVCSMKFYKWRFDTFQMPNLGFLSSVKSCFLLSHHKYCLELEAETGANSVCGTWLL